VKSKALLAALATLASAGSALANGAFPLANQLLVHPSDPDQLLMRGNFGLVVSRDGGQNWDWLCEAGMGYENIEPPMAVLGSGVVLLALPSGISRSDPSWCSFEPAAGISANVVDVSIEKAVPGATVAVSFDLVARSSTVWASTDDGASWSALGDAFDAFEAGSIDVAPSDSDRLYVSGRTLPGGSGTLLRSDDHGATWSAYDIPFFIPSQPFIAAVDPDDPDTVYVRRNGTPGTLWVTRDGGETFTMALRLTGPLKAFALSPDGEQVLVGSLTDGIHRAPTDTLAFERVACDGAQCLSWTEAGLLSCGDLVVNRYLVGRSTDDGETFDTILASSCVRGPLECEASTSVGVCPETWPLVQMQLSTLECADDPGGVPLNQACFETGGAGGSGGSAEGGAGAGGEPAGGSSRSGGSSGSGGSGGSPPATESAQYTPTGGGPCSFGSSRLHAWAWISAFGPLGARLLRRSRARFQGHTAPTPKSALSQ